MLRISAAALFGIVTHAIRKLGPSIIIFAYLYFAHREHAPSYQLLGFSVPAEYLLAGLVALASALMVALRSAILDTGHKLDLACLPQLDQLVLKHIHHFDLRLNKIRVKAKTILEGLKGLAVFLALIVISAFNSLHLAVIITGVVILVCLIAFAFPDPAIAKHERRSLVALAQSDNYSEFILIAGLLAGFVMSVPKGNSMLSDSVVLLLVARFSGALKVLVKAIRYTVIWSRSIQLHWRQEQLKTSKA